MIATERPELIVQSAAGARLADALRWFTWRPQPRFARPALALKGERATADKLAQRTVLVAGLGAVGGRAFSALARLGLGNLFGIDPDCYGHESYLTQPCQPGDEGLPKAQVQGSAAHRINPAGNVWTAQGLGQDLPLWLLRKADVLVVSGDNLEILVWAAERAMALGKPLLQGAVFGEAWVGIVRGYDLRDAENACPACQLSAAEWRGLSSRVGCDPALGVAPGREPTRTLPHVCSLAADLLVGETLKALTSAQPLLSGEELQYCLLSHRLLRTRLPRNPECRLPHKQWELIDIGREPSEVTLASLAKEQGRAMQAAFNDGQCQVRGELPWAASTLCPQCRERVVVRSFGRIGASSGRCHCGAELTASPLGLHAIVPAEDVRQIRDVTLHELGLPPGAAVGLGIDGTWTYFFIGAAPEPPPADMKGRMGLTNEGVWI